MARQIKSRQRVADHGEVFTSEREVNAMLDLVKQETERVDSRFLEPACGDGNFMAAILERKLAAARKLSVSPRTKLLDPLAFEKNSLMSVASIYGVDLLMDNVLAARERLYEIWSSEYDEVLGAEANEACRNTVRFILSKNIVCGNALTLMCVDERQNDTSRPLVFSEWTLPFNDFRIQRKDYSFAELLAAGSGSDKFKKTGEIDLFSGGLDGGSCEPILLKQYVFDYRRDDSYDR